MTRERKPSNQTLQLVSAFLTQSRRWAHGYDLSMATGLKSGTLYPILMRLCDRELLEHKWQDSPDPGRPPRHMYRLTPAGLGFARQQLADGESNTWEPSVSPRNPS